MLPDSLNPRYSYGGSKIISELIAFNYGLEHFQKVQVFRPHNIYGPDMGWKHVVPQFIEKLSQAELNPHTGRHIMTLQGDGSETRAFCYVDDVVRGILTMYERGGHREVYHIGNDEEVSIAHLARALGETLGLEVELRTSEAAMGGTPRRCPDITKMRALGYEPRVSLREGLALTAPWYLERGVERERALEGNALL
jgi:UDP-glucose 4-epimerase